MAKAKATPTPTLTQKTVKAGLFSSASVVIVSLLGLIVANSTTVGDALVKFGIPVVVVNVILVIAKDVLPALRNQS